MRATWRSAILVLVLSLGSVAGAAEWFVDQKDPAADDRNPGTEAKPVKTIPAGVKLAQPGDTIWVKEGNYEDRVVLDKSATAARPIVLSAWKDDRVRIGYLPRPLPVARRLAARPRQQELPDQADGGRAGRLPAPAGRQADPHLAAGRAAQGREGQLGVVPQVGPHAHVQRRRQEPRAVWASSSMADGPVASPS